jgi:hypothetical protein
MLGYPNQAFCGVCFETLRGRANWERKKIEYREIAEESNVCPDCWGMLTEKVRELAEEMK